MNDTPALMAGNPERQWRISLAVAAIAIAFGLFLRFYNLDLKGLWLDEIYSLYPLYSLPSFERLFADYLISDPTAPFFEIVLLGWINLFGYSDFAVRSLTAALGCLAVVACFFVTRWALGKSAAVPATILIAFSWPAIFYSQELRTYSLVLLVSVITTAVWLRILVLSKNGQARSRPYWVLFILGPILSFAHLYGYIFAAFLWIYLAAADWVRGDPKSARWPVLGFVITNLVFLPWLAINFLAMAQMGMLDLTHIERPGITFFVDIGAFMYHHPVPAFLVGVGPILLGARVLFPKIWAALKSLDLDEPFLALICAVTIPFAAVFLFSQVKPMIFTRYLMVFVPAGIFFTALAFEEWRSGPGWLRHVALLAAALISLAWILPDHYRYRSKPQTREAAQFILATFDPQTDTVLAPCRAEPIFPSCDFSVGSLSPRLSRYVHYLNYDTLPATAIRPHAFANQDEARALAETLYKGGRETVYLIGSRGHLFDITNGARALSDAGFRCAETAFFMSSVHTCERN